MSKLIQSVVFLLAISSALSLSLNAEHQQQINTAPTNVPLTDPMPNYIQPTINNNASTNSNANNVAPINSIPANPQTKNNSNTQIPASNNSNIKPS
jgi:hypothetical protein